MGETDGCDDISKAVAKPVSQFKSLRVVPKLGMEPVHRINRVINRWRLLVINGHRLHNVAGVRGASKHPTYHVERVVRCRLLSVVKPTYKIMLSHLVPEVRER